jgi:alanyl-tRNA synthetase
MTRTTTVRKRLGELVLVLLVVGIVWYCRRREAAVRESLTLSQDWAARRDGPPESVTGSDPSALTRAASILDASPEEVPDRVAALDAKVRDLTTALEKTRGGWAARWWDAKTSDPPATDEPHVTLVDLPDGTLDDAEALAKAALDDALGITIVTAGTDGTLAVAVGEGVEDEAAGDVAREVATAAGGGAGGSPDFATGGGEADRLSGAAREVCDRLADDGFAT